MSDESILSNWHNEIDAFIPESRSLCIAILSTDREVLSINKAMSVLLKGDAISSFINPSYDDLLSADNSKPLIFEGFITIGDYSSINASIWARVFRKDESIMIIGGADASSLFDQNQKMHQLNRDVGRLHRQLISEKQILETTLEKLNSANNELIELNKSKNRFISILAHDLKSPISAVQALLEILSKNIRKYDIDTIESHVNTIYGSTQNTYKLLEDILLWVKTESGNIAYDPSTYVLYDLCTNVIDSLNHVAKRKEINLKNSVSNELSVYVDFNMINTVIRNLVSNAVKFTNKNGKIELLAEQNHSNIHITVSDNGVGIRPNILSKLFDNAHKITTNGTENEKGTGLGLLLCKELVEKNNGKIWVESVYGEGSNFKIILPSNKQ